MRRTIIIPACAFVFAAIPAMAQNRGSAPKPATTVAAKAASIDPGMTKEQVIERFGKPAGERSRGEFTYLHYGNGREHQVGMTDIVILQNDKVVDAVLRSPQRTYTGTSSSPKALSGKTAKKG